MSGARGRKAQGSEELSYGETLGTSPEAVEGRQKAGGFAMGTAAAATAGVLGLMLNAASGSGKSPAKRREENKKKREKRRARRAARGGGGGLYVTPDAAKKRDVTKRFRNI